MFHPRMQNIRIDCFVWKECRRWRYPWRLFNSSEAAKLFGWCSLAPVLSTATEQHISYNDLSLITHPDRLATRWRHRQGEFSRGGALFLISRKSAAAVPCHHSPAHTLSSQSAALLADSTRRVPHEVTCCLLDSRLVWLMTRVVFIVFMVDP